MKPKRRQTSVISVILVNIVVIVYLFGCNPKQNYEFSIVKGKTKDVNKILLEVEKIRKLPHYGVVEAKVDGRWVIIRPFASTEYFARSQFKELSDSEKLTRPPFETFPAGIVIGSNTGNKGCSKKKCAVIVGDELLFECELTDATLKKLEKVYPEYFAKQRALKEE